MPSKLTGNVDPQEILDLAPGEMNNLPGFEAWNEGATSTLGEYPAFQLGGTWQNEGLTKITAQKTVVIPGHDGVYVLQLNADGLETQSDIITAATDVIDNQTAISFEIGRRRQSAPRFGGVRRQRLSAKTRSALPCR